ncbi:uncharacterized protein LOC110452522 isoform X1 [Mizuhopecten yessoensis]|uniref:uncharacterized protein LOC110452522 isoform X1 n=1 Tax=Mizuhopecten yessoensis TaxID=6573 RepID=UPI000B45F743|nr:uncharacterized protein LOC110452522 isoform X1 [Mizuhopecten yessoensis]
MAERRSRSRTRRTTLDLENPSNWTVNQLREKLQGLGIWTPTTLSRTFLIQMYRENKALNQNTTVTFNTPNEIRSRPSTDMPTALCREVPETADAQTAAQSDTNASVHLPTTTTMAAPMTLMMECINELKNTVNRLVETNSGQRRLQASSTPSPAPTSYTLYTAIEAEKSRDIDSTPRDRQIPETSTRSRSGAPHGTQVQGGHLELDTIVQGLLEKSIAPRTKIVYETGFRKYVQFLLLHGFISMVMEGVAPPVTEDLLVLFVAYCASKLKLSFPTVKLYLCGIRHSCLRYSDRPLVNISAISSPRLNAVLNGLKRQSSTQAKPRLPITGTILANICRTLRLGVFSKFTDLMMETACTVAFFGFLRCGEFTCRSTFESGVNLSVIDVCIESDYFILTLKSSKTDPFKKGVAISLFKNYTDTCPYTVVCKYLMERQKLGCQTESLFVTDYKTPLTRNVFIEHLKHVLRLAGLNPDLYNGHSLRSGAATSAATGQVEDHLIKTLGRWSSDTYCRYIKTPKSVLKEAQKSMCFN